MNFIKLILNDFKYYTYQDASNIEMNILGNLLSSDVGCYNSFYKKWAIDPRAEVLSGNINFVEKEEDGLIHIYSSLPLEDDEKRVVLKLTPEQFVKILDDWEQKVCKSKPKEVTIKHINDEFIFETKD